MATAPLGQFDADGNLNYTPIGGQNSFGEYSTPSGYIDKEGNIWDSIPRFFDDGFSSGWTEPKLLLSAEVAKDPYISTIGIAQQDPSTAQALYDLKKSNPTEFYNQIASKLEDKIYSDWRINNTNSSTQEARSLLEGIKEENPQAYYTAKLTDLGRNVGWQIGQNRNDRNAPTIEQIQALVPEAQKAGLSAEQINSLVGSSVNQANAMNQERIANEASQGNFWTENLIGAAKVGAFALGAGGLDAALNAGATGMNGALQSYLGTTGGTFVPAEGFSATLPGFADAAGGYLSSELAGPTYQELGYTGLEAGQMGPTYAELGYTGLNNAEAIAAADAASAAAKGMTLAEALSAANKARTGLGVASSIAKLAGGQGGSQNGATGGINPQQLASLLRPTNTFNPINLGQIQPKNPFIFNTQGQTQASEGMYDVSGMANALRNR